MPNHGNDGCYLREDVMRVVHTKRITQWDGFCIESDAEIWCFEER